MLLFISPIEPDYPPQYREEFVKTTAYTIGDNYTPNTVCADGSVPRKGIVAYNRVPLGTKVYIDGIEYIVRDRTLRDNVLDIYMDNHADAVNYGVQWRTIVIKE